ncbi:hypothetical protein [Parasitella parasitica]|uniref:C3H1-type domain-containing protein n=1 Tax=Parasitella parasitica TaxID=35722 RepID=A0A0B7MWM5_9FUNG|nr:hypothetical protein [Parasitella parasitica]
MHATIKLNAIILLICLISITRAFNIKDIIFGNAEDSEDEASIIFGSRIAEEQRSNRPDIPCQHFICEETETCVFIPSECPCRLETEIKCKVGDWDELRPILRSNQYKTKICKAYHDSGNCSYGIRCTFIHQMNATDKNHYNLVPPISPASSNSSFQSSMAQTDTKHQHCSELDLNSNMFISKNIMEDIIDLSSYEPQRH